MRAKVPKIAFFVGLTLLVLLLLSIAFQLSIPVPTGSYPVGQRAINWVDSSRPEKITENPDDFREVIALVWYPAEKGSGTNISYFPGLKTVSNGLIASGEVEPWEVYSLPFIRSDNLWDAKPTKNEKSYPVVIFSPGNGTNAEFYTVLASELASHGYIVVGLNHPYDVAAVELSDHKVASYYKEQDAMEMNAHEEFIAERIQVRTQDVLFAWNQLEQLNADASSPFAGLLDKASVGVAGHSLGGITASEACKANSLFRACINLDGIQRGGPFSTEASAIPPKQPFLFLTKEAQLPPKWIEKFESTNEGYWVIIQGASHESFTDGPILLPSLLPLPNRADRIMSLIEEYTLAFLDQTLKNQHSALLSKSEKMENVTMHVYPSH